MIEKIISRNVGVDSVKPGQIQTVNVDRVMIHDIFIPFVAEKFEEMGFTKLWDPDKVVLIYDHMVPASTIDDIRHFKIGDAFAKKYGMKNVHRSDGICHQLMTECGYAKPGNIVFGTDSHTTTYGCVGCFSSGIGYTEMAAILLDIKPGDEVIMPSYTFVSTADAFVLRGAKIVFVDIRPDTMNIDEKQIEAAITEKTKAIVPVHYAGVACEMDTIMDIAKRHNLLVIEDAAQGVMSSYKGKALGTIGDYGCFSFHETKNYSMGEGGAIVINNPAYIEKAEILRWLGMMAHACNPSTLGG